MGRATKQRMKAPSVKHNIIANFAGRAWSAIMGLVFIPLYIKFMGMEAYGLIGLFLSIVALLSILDMGLSSTLSRELARLSASQESAQESKDLVRTLEVVYWGVGILVGLGLVALAPIIANHWVKVQGIPLITIERTLMIMGFVIASQWPASLYSGGLIGLQRQVLLNEVRAAMATFQHGGAVLALWLISPTILTYFTWQIFASAAQTLLLAYSVWKSLPVTSQKSNFRTYLLRKNLHFAAGMMGISIMSIILTQTDKIVLSKLLTLTLFGYYTLAFNLANSLAQLVNPIFSALFPKFSQLTENDHESRLSEYYHKSCQLVSVIILPVAGVLAFFSEQILKLWIRDPVIAQNSHLLLSLLVIGSALNALMTLPFGMQLAYGWTRLSFLKNVVAAIILVPLMLWLVKLYGAPGAAAVWIILNLGYFFIEIPIMHSRVLKPDMWRWYFQDVGLPLFVIVGTVLCSRILMPHTESSYINFIWILMTGLLALFASTLTAPFGREWIRKAATL